ncbi:3-dehydroquinate synthase [Solimonas marina]|uniref:3-dehydroquinate synthase n=1 Tax=Solimonas marina TaxID=2714601 RepID=A0A969W684_9GAMM|nr:3-dehydroquinate synthase [Solimonas marina]NKF21162.1 3-dehydroquinate synthase [Solimonas marina]
MDTLDVDLGQRSYPIHIGTGLLSRPELLTSIGRRPMRLVTDAHVAEHYLTPVRELLSLDDEQILVLPAGETTKSMATVDQVMDWLLASRLPRDGMLVALGGGVIGDLVGFCAAIYQRGVDFVQIPTTLLAQVDSSVGGKTGVNHARGKNMIGAFHQPRLVLADTGTLATLPQREKLAGIAEVIKYGMLGDAAFFAWLERNMSALLALDDEAVRYAVYRSCEMKAEIVALDERESVDGGAGPRALLNLGHTFAHAVETYTHYTEWLHGEAVAVGLCMAADLSARLGWLAGRDADRCIALVASTGLPTRPPQGMRVDDFRTLMSLDKKVASGKLRLILLRSLGDAVVSADFDSQALDATLRHFGA